MKRGKSILVADYKNRVMWLDGEITPKIAFRFSNMINMLNRRKVAPIVIYIRGPGGDSWSMLSMMNVIFNSPSPIGCVAYDCVASGCFTLIQAGIWRAALAGTRFVFHSASGFSYAHKNDLEQSQKDISDWLERVRLVDFFQLFWFSMRGRPVQMIQKMLKSNTVLSLSEAKKFNLIDSYFDKKDFLEDRKSIRKIIKAKT